MLEGELAMLTRAAVVRLLLTPQQRVDLPPDWLLHRTLAATHDLCLTAHQQRLEFLAPGQQLHQSDGLHMHRAGPS